MAANGRGLFFLYIYIEKLEKSSCQKPLDRFHYNLAKKFPWWPSTKIVQVIVICQKTWLLGVELFFPIYLYRKLKKLLVRNHWTDFTLPWQKRFIGDPLPRLFKPSWFVKTWLVGAGLIFPIYIYIENLKKSSCQKPLDRFQYNLADMFPWWPFIKIVQPTMICQKTCLVGAGGYFPRISTQKTLMIFLSETTGLISI